MTQHGTGGRSAGGAITDALPEGGGAAAEPGGVALCRRLRRGELAGIAEVRAALRQLLRGHRGWVGSDRVDVAELLTSELVANALVHTDRDAEVAVRLGGRRLSSAAHRLRVEVRDFVARHPRPRCPDSEGTSGRGLLLVQSLSDAWGVLPHTTGKIVWFELERDRV